MAGTARNSALVVLLGAIWGAVYPLTTRVLHDLPASTVVAARAGLAAVVLLPLAVSRGQFTKFLRLQPVSLLIAAVLQATAPLVLLTVGQQHVSASLSGILSSTQPVWAVILIMTVTGHLSKHQAFGVLLGLAGIVAIYARNLGHTSTAIWAGSAVLASAFLFAAGAVWIDRRLTEVPALTVAATAMTVSSLALLPFAIASHPHFPSIRTATWLTLLGAGGTGGGLVLFYRLIRSTGAVRAGIAFYLAPAFAVGGGVVFLSERIGLVALGGLVLILLGAHLTLSSPRRSPVDGDQGA